jgi:hypothetical protein
MSLNLADRLADCHQVAAGFSVLTWLTCPAPSGPQVAKEVSAADLWPLVDVLTTTLKERLAHLEAALPR